jgi:hypothetical protein
VVTKKITKGFQLILQLCLTLLLVSAAFAEEKKEDDSKSKAVPLEKKLDKRGLLNLGYGYGINGLDIGYIGGGGGYGGAYHSAPAHHYGSPIYLGHKTDIQKTVTVLKGVPVPYEVSARLIKYFNHC